MKTSEVKAALRGHYKDAEYALMFEVGDATGSRKTRSADAVAMNLWPSRGLQIEGIEIKVSRSDWRRELDNPAKSAAVQRFCDLWWVVAPAGIVQEVELPVLWGLKEVNKNGAIRVVKKAPELNPEPVTKGFVAAMLRRASSADAAEVDFLVEKQLTAARARIDERVKNEVERRTRKLSIYAEKIEKLKEIGIDLTHPYLQADQIVEAYRIGRAIQSNHTLMGLHHIASRVEESAEALREAHALLSPNQENLDNT